MKKIYYTLGVLFLSSSMASATQHALKLLIESATPKRALKAITTPHNPFLFSERKYSTIRTPLSLEQGKSMQVFSRPTIKPPVSRLVHTESSSTEVNNNKQVYAVPTYDATFKYMLSDPKICLSFLRTFVLNHNIKSIEKLDESLVPIQRYQVVQSLINDSRSKSFMNRISKLNKNKDDQYSGLDVVYTGSDKKVKSIANGAWFISEMSEVYGDILNGFPTSERNSAVDVLCRLDNGSHALIEVQVIEEDYWDQRALAYAASVYSRQMRKGNRWEDLQNVICINILGGGIDSVEWDSVKTFRHLRFKDQNNTPIGGGIEIFQYPLYHRSTVTQASKEAHDDIQRLALQEWIDFLEHASRKREADVSKIKTVGLREAYEKIKYQTLPEEVKIANEKQDEELFKRSRRVIEKKEEKAREEEKKNIARKMREKGIDDKSIAEITGLSDEQLKELK